MRVAIGSDHAGLPLKEPLTALLEESGHSVIDLGTYSPEPCDYPDIAERVGQAVVTQRVDRGIVLCGSAQGASIAANKIPGIRAAVGHDTYSAHQSVEHDDANVLCLGARVIGPSLATEIVDLWVRALYTGEERHQRRVEKVKALEHALPLIELQRAGQSAWMDNISLDLLGGEFRELIVQGITGVTSNPTIMEKSISGSVAYDPAIRRLVRAGSSARDIAIALWVDDIRGACDQLRSVYELSEGADGFASIEVDAELAHDTERTILEGRRLWQAVDRPNVMIKVPATEAGLPAIQQLTAEGINVNITLLFARSVYEQVMEAYIAGLEQWFATHDDAERPPASVASFFVSRVDTKVDSALKGMLAGELSDARRTHIQSLLGTAAIANAKLAYQRYLSTFSGVRWNRLAGRGARVQRPLWASTSTKDPSYRDVLYVEELIGPDTINTMPPATIEAFAHHGYVRTSVTESPDLAQQQLDAIAALGIDLDAITDQLQHEGVEAFETSFDTLLQAIDAKREAILLADRSRIGLIAGGLAPSLQARLKEAENEAVVRRVWEHDASVWTEDPAESAAVRDRLGWLEIPRTMHRHIPRLQFFAEHVCNDGYTDVVLLGMGGSSLAPEVFKRIFGSAPGFPRLTVLDTTVPDTIQAAEHQIDLAHTVFIVASKSGTTIETLSHLAHFWEKTGRRGEQFVAITDPGTPLEQIARERGFRDCFVNPPDIGGRYSALSFFGLVPAALLGMDLDALLLRAVNHLEICHEPANQTSNVGLQLGMFMGVAAREGRDKLTLLAPGWTSSFGLWVEQLIAESTGKRGVGIVPIVGEPLQSLEVYRNDRAFVALMIEGDTSMTEEVQRLIAAGHPVAMLRVENQYDLIGQCLTLEFATAISGALLGINPFDEPNVQEAKDQTKLALLEFQQSGSLPAVENHSVDDVLNVIQAARGGDYVSIQAYLPYDPVVEQSLESLRASVLNHCKVATTLGFGPRFLHSTGQLHKGGPGTGIFVQIVGDFSTDIPIPETPYTFGILNQAQAVGDFQALERHDLRVVRFSLGPDTLVSLAELTARLQASQVCI